jgi:hypothetical protein
MECQTVDCVAVGVLFHSDGDAWLAGIDDLPGEVVGHSSDPVFVDGVVLHIVYDSGVVGVCRCGLDPLVAL